jgi:twitching motility protein PilT
MTTLEDSIMEFLKKKMIAPEEAYEKAVDKSRFLSSLPQPPEDLGLV